MLDPRKLDIDWPQAFPTVLASCLRHGIDPRRMPIPVSAAVRFHMGGVKTDTDGRSSVPGLYAVGEVACNGLHGANRLASNSLLECAVFGRRLGAHLRTQDCIHHDRGKPLIAERGVGLCSEDLQRLRATLWRAAGPVRSTRLMQEGIATLDPLLARGWQARLGQRLLTAAFRRSKSVGAHWHEDAETLSAIVPSVAA